MPLGDHCRYVINRIAMIPNIFISSTISDLQYLRDAIRDAVVDLRYHPVMSEHGEVGYIRPTTAATACYRTVEQCHMVILIVGKRYGSIGDDGLSVTHKEYLAAKDANIPTITLVEQQVLHYKEVFDASPSSDLWNSFPRMDKPSNTFKLIDDISSSDVFNGLISFTSAVDAKEKLKLQIADFVGERLGDTIAPMSKQIKDVLAEIKTLRNQVAHGPGDAPDTKKYLAATRFLLSDNASEYRKLLEQIFGDIDFAVSKIWSLPEFSQVIEEAGFTCDTVSNEEMNIGAGPMEPPGTEQGYNEDHAIFGQYGRNGGCTVYLDKRIKMSQSYYDKFSQQQKKLHAKASVT